MVHLYSALPKRDADFIFRLTPPYAFLILFSISVWPKLGDGPFWWSTTAQPMITSCQKYWYTNLLYFNNLYPVQIENEVGQGQGIFIHIEWYAIIVIVTAAIPVTRFGERSWRTAQTQSRYQRALAMIESI